ncbi:hypothetical protein [Curtobacterium sp. L1-20]|uniref:hypothetical protein n=1 Tax=Curtobacterium sp. L1-20 TaxID=3138181 RepID=UPI003B51BD4D
MQTKPWRITTAQAKVGYVVASAVVEVLVVLLLLALDVSPSAVGLLGALWFLATVLVGVRVFRGPGEPVAPPRAWWRMTAGPVVGYLLAAYFVADGVVARGLAAERLDLGGAVVSVLVAAAYAASSTALVVLRVQGRPAPGSVSPARVRDSGSDPARG